MINHPLLGVVLAAVLISLLLIGCRLLLTTFVYGRAPGRQAIRAAHHSRVARIAVQDLDREYEELLRS